ncbi:hypothetical protein ROZALSC1DRAFT_28083 [Rozella allomycis CSF55]|uniref:DUSP domain-containing protein n=1 Tax=Rozella allomycis (strain CSF55) TaxID=988480 RepID=A0A075AMV9_ROZAC|nr:hypothetical protein O9G_001510 [Rozella allomycis CSF55]RKP20430.1 hypothetical protein ROZALSC1DRAFT_28083 [Rozella allomycis CSF55]|eukprot:EPZ31036.1 hypothetical protein O9G_001510 [Rozella allomycis CSF55]
MHYLKELNPSLQEGLVDRIPRNVFEYFVRTYGSDDPNSYEELEKCEICRDIEIKLDEKRKKMTDEIKNAKAEESDTYFHVNINWLKKYEKFLLGDKEPGTISNASIVDNGRIRKNLTRGIHYRSLTKSVWDLLYNEYGADYFITGTDLSIYNSKLDNLKPSKDCTIEIKE